MEIRVQRTIEVLNKPIEILVADTGAGINITVSGGERGHIGAVAVASPGLKTEVITLPDHKETVVVEKWAEEVCSLLGQTTVVEAGIHYDNLSKEGIAAVLNALDEELSKILKQFAKNSLQI